MSDDADTQREQIEMLQAMRGQSAELGAAADAAQARLDEAAAATAAAAPAPAAAAAAAAPHHHLGGGGGRHQLESGGVSQGGGGPAAPAAADAAPLGSRARKAQELSVAMGRGGSAAAAEELDKSHKFWSTQPVPKMAASGAGAPAQQHGPLEPLRSPEEVKKTPLPLPKSFEWCTLDVADPAQLSEMYTLLCDNYVEDDDAMFRFAYPQPFLQWSLTPPHYQPSWHVGVRMLRPKSGALELVACITGVPATLECYGRQRAVCEINFLCVDKRLRDKRLAPTLIKEVTRRVNLCGVWQAVYTAGVVLPRPVASTRYWHRSIDPRKLIDVGFSRLPQRTTMARMQLHYKLPGALRTGGLRGLEARDVPSAALALNAYWGRFALRPVMSAAEVAHWLLPRAGVVDCAVLTRRLPRRAAREEARAAVARMCARRRQWLSEHPSGGSEGGSAAAAAGSAAAAAAAAGVAAAGAGGGSGEGEGWGGGGQGDSGSAASGAGRYLTEADWEELVRAAVGEGGEEEEVEMVTDLVSFYHLPSTVIGNQRHSHLYAAYLYYYVSDAIPLKQLLEDTLVLAQRAKIDVLNCLDLAENAPLLEELKFGPGDGFLQYYLFNWACPQCEPKGVGLVLH